MTIKIIIILVAIIALCLFWIFIQFTHTLFDDFLELKDRKLKEIFDTFLAELNIASFNGNAFIEESQYDKKLMCLTKNKDEYVKLYYTSGNLFATYHLSVFFVTKETGYNFCHIRGCNEELQQLMAIHFSNIIDKTREEVKQQIDRNL